MHIQINTSFVASTAVPVIKTVFDVYAQKQHFEVQFDLKDDRASKKVVDQNLNKVVKNLILIESELDQFEYKSFYRRFIDQFEQYASFMLSAEKINGFDSFRTCVHNAIQDEKAKQAKRLAKREAKATK